MSEIDLIQAYSSSISLAYTSAQWWIAVSTALVVATYFAAKHIPSWLFAVIIALYLTTSVSALWETTVYGGMADQYWLRLTQFRDAHHVPQFEPGGGPILAALNPYFTYAVIALGTISAAMFAFVRWRQERTA